MICKATYQLTVSQQPASLSLIYLPLNVKLTTE